MLNIKTTRTIPYSMILKYKSPFFFSKTHNLIYKLPNGKKRKVMFKISYKKNSKVFATKIKEYMATVNSFRAP